VAGKIEAERCYVTRGQAGGLPREEARLMTHDTAAVHESGSVATLTIG
jgi:hypothetical protein